MSLDNIFCGVARDSVKDVEINNNIEVKSEFVYHFSGKFAINRPSSKIQFASRI